jgi:asparagine synthase (glutamine-hydrolysing)
MFDEPFAESSQISTHLVSKVAKSQVTVALSGDGGEELFGGYNRYLWGPRIWDRRSKLPFGVRRVLGNGIAKVPVSVWGSLGCAIKPIMPGTLGVVQVGDKPHKLAKRLGKVINLDYLYLSLVSEWTDSASDVKFLDDENDGRFTKVSVLNDQSPTQRLDESQLS